MTKVFVKQRMNAAKSILVMIVAATVMIKQNAHQDIDTCVKMDWSVFFYATESCEFLHPDRPPVEKIIVK